MAQRVSAPASGLAYRHDFNADMQRTAQIEAVREHKKQENLKTSEYLAEQMKTTTVQGPARVKEYEDHIMSVNEKVADFFINNRDFMSDPGKFAEFKNITKQYIDNPIVEKDLRVEEHRKRLEQAAATQQLTKREIELEQSKYQEYLNNPDADPYVFVMPKRMDIMDISKESVASLGIISDNYMTDDGVRVNRSRVNQISANKALEVVKNDEDKWMVVTNTYDQLGLAETGITAEQWYKDWIISQKDVSEIKDYTYSSYNPNNSSGSGGIGVDWFKEEIWNADGVSQAIESGGDATTRTDENLAFFTQNGGVGDLIIGSDDEFFFVDKGGFALEQAEYSKRDVNSPYLKVESKRKKLDLSGSSATTSIINSKQMNVVGGVAYMLIEMAIDIDPANSDLVESLKENGFKSVEKPSSGGGKFEFYSMGPEKTTEKYVGKVLQRANLSAVNMKKYNDKLNGQKGQDNLDMNRSESQQRAWKVERATRVRENPNEFTQDPITGDWNHVSGEYAILKDFSGTVRL